MLLVSLILLESSGALDVHSDFDHLVYDQESKDQRAHCKQVDEYGDGCEDFVDHACVPLLASDGMPCAMAYT